MEDISHHSRFSRRERRLSQDTESQYHLDEVEDDTSPEFMDAYSINATGDGLFTNVPIEDPDEYIEQEHDPIWQPRGGHFMNLGDPHEEDERRAAQLHGGASSNLLTVQMYHGNLVLDCPIPPRLLNQVAHVEPPHRDEYTHTRYSAVTCDPRDFREQGYTLRPRLFARARRTELLVAVTMYDEDEILLGQTIQAIMKNLEHLCLQKSSTVWGKDAWKNVVVCIISDGRRKINQRSLALLAGLGVYQNGIANQKISDKMVIAHTYEYTTQMRIEIVKDQVKLIPNGDVPCQMIFCLKEWNRKKVNSHRWLFQAFADILSPNICILLDAGTVPVRHAFYSLWDTLRRDPTCGCAVGEYKTKSKSSLLDPLVAMQHFEYKIKNLLDRPLESLFGHRFDMLGAVSAYRYAALSSDRHGNGPLQRYFLTDLSPKTDLMHTNMALAEDRILSFELVIQKNCSWRLIYVASAFAEVDVPPTLSEFLMQRRRWLNGNTFLSLYSFVNFVRVLETAHSTLRKLALAAQFGYQAASMCFSWFSLGLFFLTFYITTISLRNELLYGRTGYILAQFFGVLYLVNIFLGFNLALGNSPYQTRKLYTTISFVWTLIMIYFIFAVITLIVKVSQTKDDFGPTTVSKLFQTQLFWALVIPILVTYGIWWIVAILFLSPWHMIASLVQYILFLPTSVNLVSVYAFCNLHDVSWGTKGSAEDIPALGSAVETTSGSVQIYLPTDIIIDEHYDASMALLNGARPLNLPATAYGAGTPERYYKGWRTFIVFSWVLSNAILIATIINVPSMNEIKFGPALQASQGSVVFIAIIFWRIAGDAVFKFAGVLAYLIIKTFQRK